MTNKLTAAARSTCPTAVAGFETAPGREAEAAGGRGAVGMGGFADPFAETLGFTGITGGFGLAATGGGGLDPIAELGRELAGVVSTGEGFFHGVADPLEACIPGNTDIGLDDASATTGVRDIFGAGVGAGRDLGGGGGAETTLGGTSSR